MESLMKSDIFFFITSIAVVILTMLLAVAVTYAIRILRNVDDISTKAKDEAGLIKEDIAELRQNLKTEGSKIKHFANFFNKLKGRRPKKGEPRQ
jgi:5-bromo-4-chloroindolyl phosphate hydrolysis protein